MNQGFGQPPQQPGHPGQPQPGYGPPNQGFGPPPQPSASGLAIGSLVMGILSWVMFPVVAAIAGAIMGKMELGNIERGESPMAGKSFAQIGYWLSIANIIVTLVTAIGICCLYAGIIGLVFGSAATNGY